MNILEKSWTTMDWLQQFVAMIINGLGFPNRSLYLTPQFFESKSMSALFEEELKTSDNNDDKPSHCQEVTYGFSKENRAFLKQVMMSLVMNGPANITLWM